ncbi:MAG: Hsp70 family protein, partial [Kiritimatiellales bacterium]|nr:Hsp70 family protein [Kiritimatiellales bacterium]
FQTEKFLKENGDKISAENKSAVEAAIEPVKEALKSDNDEQIKSTLEKLNEVMQAAATEMYSKAQSEAQAQPPADDDEQPKKEKQADGDVVDADYTMEDDKK